jgi:hypothetical protein
MDAVHMIGPFWPFDASLFMHEEALTMELSTHWHLGPSCASGGRLGNLVQLALHRVKGGGVAETWN